MVKLQTRAIAAGAALVVSVAFLSACATRTDSAAPQAGATPRTSCDEKGDSQGITDSTIKLGMFTPLTGPVADPGNGALDGFKVALDLLNSSGGVNGHKVELTAVDDKYDASVAQQAARRLNTEDKVFAFAGGIGTPNFVGVLPYIKQNSIPAVGPYAPSNQVGVIKNPDVFMIWPNFIDEFDVATSWALAQKNAPKSISLLQQVGDTGDDALTGIQKALKGTGLKLDTVQSIEPTTTDFSSVAQALKNANSDMVAMIVTPTATAQVISAMKQIGYTPRLLAQSDMTDESWLSQYAGTAQGMIVPTKVAPFSTDDPQVKDFVTKFTTATGHAPTMWNAVGYTQALVTFEALNESKALTRDCFEFALENMHDYKTGLIPPVTFASDSRQGTNAVGVGKIEDDQVVQVAPFQLVK